MASPTYSASNGITKPVTGQDINLWGLDLNNNFDLIDQAVDGIANIPLTGLTAAVTITNGQLSNGRCSVLKFTGALSAPCTVSLPASAGALTKVYWIINNCGQSITLQQALNGVPGTTLSVANGTSEPVLCDGQGNVVSLGVSTSSSPGDFTVSGSLTVNGSEEVKGNLTVDGTALIKSDLTVNGNTVAKDISASTIETTGDINAAGNMFCNVARVSLIDFDNIANVGPYTNAIALGAGAGAGAALNVSGAADGCGQIQITTGSSPVALSAILTVTLAKPTTALNVVFSPRNAAAAAAQVYAEHNENSGEVVPDFTLYSGNVALAANTVYAWSYIAIQ